MAWTVCMWTPAATRTGITPCRLRHPGDGPPSQIRQDHQAGLQPSVMTNGRFADVAKAEPPCAIRSVILWSSAAAFWLIRPAQQGGGKSGEDIRPCISCNEGCIGRVYKGLPASCAVNPRCGYEDGSRDNPKAENTEADSGCRCRPRRLCRGPVRQGGWP
jgi:hypothetical protein